jgi:hypothetical protein
MIDMGPVSVVFAVGISFGKWKGETSVLNVKRHKALVTRSRRQPDRVITMIRLTWPGPRGVAGYTEVHACAWQPCQPVLSDP